MCEMSEIIIVGSMKARPGQETALRDTLAELAFATHAEQGCILYAVHQGTDEPNRFVIIERWQSQEALDEHIRSDYMTAVLARAGELLADAPDSAAYTALPYGDIAKGTLAGYAA
jgi:quinol monooxygenase YgiN